MKKKIYENGIEYVLVGDYYFPNMALPQKKHNIGKYGLLHKEYIKQHHPGFYSELILSGKLNDYLYEVDTTARNFVESYISDGSIKQGVTEKLKAEDPMKWVGLMNNIKAQAEEIIYSDIVYA